MFKGQGTYIAGFGLLAVVIIGAILHTLGLIPLEVAGVLYVSILPLAVMALKRAIVEAKDQISSENNRISAENQCLDEKMKELRKALEEIKEATNAGRTGPGPEGGTGEESRNEKV